MFIEITDDEKEWVGVALRQARDQLAEDDGNWDGSEGAEHGRLLVRTMETITSLLHKLDENEHPSFRLARD
jgi:hypothetical protein